MSTLRVSNIEAKADPSSPSVDEKLKVTNSNGDILVHIDGKTAGVTTIGINTTDRSFTVDAAQNVEFLGIVTATKFSLSGGGEITGGDGNFTGIVTSGSGNFTGGLTVGTAVTAATANFTSSLTAASANFTGNVSIAGTLTYEDVTNVDSVGIATARDGIDVTGGHIDLVDDSKIRVGTGDDLEIEHDTSQAEDVNVIKSASNLQLQIRADKLRIIDTDATQDLIHADVDGSAKLFYAGSKKLETTGIGVSVSGALEVTQEYPSIRPILDLNFAATKTLDRRITFTRNGVGTYVDDMGIIKYSSKNTPRFDHDPVTGESLGLLIEESRTNQMIYSSDITGDTAQNGTITGDATTAPDGTTTADKYAANSTNGIHRVDHAFTSGQILNSTVYTFSVFAKANGYDKLHIRYAGYNADNHGRGYDLSDGTTFDGKFDGTSSLDAVTSSSMIAYPNGWYRCIFTVTTAADAASGVAQLLYYISNSEATTNFAGDGSSGMYFWGAQMEEGYFPTSYIPTSGSTVIRAADLATIKGTNFTDFYNQTEGTLFGEFTIKDTTYSSAAIANINQEPGSSYAHSIMFVEVGTANGYFGRTYKNSSGVNISNSSSVLNSLHPSTTPQKVSFGYTTVSGGELRAYWNGNNVDSRSDLSKVPTTLTNMRIGRGWTGSDVINAHIKKLSYYNKRLPNAQLQGLTQQ